jgi:flagellin-specific chaperone FliS
MLMDATVAAAYKKVVMSSEAPDLDWIIRGWRGLRTYLATAIRAIDREDLSARVAACGRASELMVLLRRITPDGHDSALGQRLAMVYDTLHIELAKANAAGDRTALQGIVQALASLEHGFAPSGQTQRAIR